MFGEGGWAMPILVTPLGNCTITEGGSGFERGGRAHRLVLDCHCRCSHFEYTMTVHVEASFICIDERLVLAV